MDHEHGIGTGRVDMERVPDSAKEVDGSEARGTNRERASRTTTKILSRWSGGYRDKYGCTGKGGGGGRREAGTTKATRNQEQRKDRRA